MTDPAPLSTNSKPYSATVLRGLSLLSLAAALAACASLLVDAVKTWAIAAILLSYLSFCARCYLPGWRKHRQPLSKDLQLLIAYASQTGFAYSLAQHSLQHFEQAGWRVELCPIEQLQIQQLSKLSGLLVIASTTGEGDAPDHAQAFQQQMQQHQAELNLQHLNYAILGLGDRHYQQFCQFAHQLDHWFSQHGAQAWFDLIEVDNADAAAIRHWQHQLAQLSGYRHEQDWEAPAYQSWQLLARELLNPGSQADPVYKIQLRAEQAGQNWQAGDIAEIGAPEADPVTGSDILHSRDYSIASLSSDGVLELIVRLVRLEHGQFGLGSGWLCQRASLQQTIALRIRANPHFQPRPGSQPLILIGNGTGIAGLRAHLKQRIADGQRQNALFFGERQRAYDYLCQAELEAWQAQGFLPELHLCFSRDQASKYYVQDALLAQAELLRDWLAEGAEILVCGSLQGMATAVHHVLQDLLGNEQVQQLQASGRYRRDVY